MIEGFAQVKQERLRLAFLIAFGFGGKVGEVLKSPFL